VMQQHNIWCVRVAHTPKVMLPHHHNWTFTFLKIF